MMRPLAVLRPEPGNAATAAAIEAAGLRAQRLPLFAVRALPWVAPDPAGYDALLLTSGNAVRHAGAGLAALARLPVLAVGEATAAAARSAGLAVALTGHGGAAALLEEARARGIGRLLHLAGRERTVEPRPDVAIVTVYASDPVPLDRAALTGLAGAVALLHSARAARRLGALLDAAAIGRERIRLAAIGPHVLDAAGSGWAAGAIAAVPTDAALIAAGGALAD